MLVTTPEPTLPGGSRLQPGTLRATVPPTRRAMEWLPVAATSALAVGLVVHGLVVATELPATGHLIRVRVAMVLLAAATAYALHDPAHPTIAAAPVPLSRRRLIRLGLIGGTWATGWATVLGLVATAGGALPAGQLTVEAVGWFTLSLAAASVAGGPAAAPVLLGAFVAMSQLPDRWALLVSLDDGWTAVQLRWGALAMAAAAALAWTSRDPAR